MGGDPYYERPPFSHGGLALGAAKAGAGHLPRALWVQNRLLANHEAGLQRAHHERRVGLAHALVPRRPDATGRRAEASHPSFEVSVFPCDGALVCAHRFAIHVDGKPCATLELERGTTYTFSQSHFSNLGDDTGHFHMRFFDGEGADSAEYSDGVRASVVPPGMPGAHVLLRVSAGAPSVLYYRCGSGRADGLVDGGLVLVRGRVKALQPDLDGAPKRANTAAVPSGRRKALDFADGLAERERRFRANVTILAQRSARQQAIEEAVGGTCDGGLYRATHEQRLPVWNSRPRDARHWTGGHRSTMKLQ